MNVGRLSDLVTIQRPTTVVDAIGGTTEGAPADVAVNVPAAVEALSLGMDRIQVGQLRGAVTKRVVLRYREDVTDEMRVLWRGHVLEIGLVDQQYREQQTVLLCAEVQ